MPATNRSASSLLCRLTSVLLSRLLLDLHAYTTRRETRFSGAVSTIQFGGNEDRKDEHLELTAPIWLTDSETTGEETSVI